MADKTINDLTASGGLVVGDLFEIENTSNNSRKATLAQLQAFVSPILYSGTSAVGTTTSTSETDLMAYTMPANTLAVNGQAIRVTAAGTMAAVARSRTVKAYFGSSGSMSIDSASNTIVHWGIDYTVVRTGAATQVIRGSLRLGIAGGNEDANHRSRTFNLTQDLTTALAIKVTGTVAAGATANDIVNSMLLVEHIR